MSTKKRNIIVAAISVVLVAIVFIVIFAMQSNARADEPQSEPSSELVSSEPVSSAITVPPIKAPTVSSKPTSSEEASSETEVVPPVVDVTASVDTSSEEAAPTWNETAFEKTMYTNQSCSSRKQPIKGAAVVAKLAINTEVKVTAKTDTEYYKLADGAFVHQSFLSEQKTEIVSTTEKPQANESYAKPANRNMPSFTVDNSVTGPQGYHGQTDGNSYYHAGLDSWVDATLWFAFRFGEHPNASKADMDYLNKYQRSPFQQDGDFKPDKTGGHYYCATCSKWVHPDYWESGKHFNGNPKHK